MTPRSVSLLAVLVACVLPGCPEARCAVPDAGSPPDTYLSFTTGHVELGCAPDDGSAV